MSIGAPIRAKLIALPVIMVLSGVVALPVHDADTSTDVPTGHSFHDHIAWLAEEGVTRAAIHRTVVSGGLSRKALRSVGSTAALT